MLVLKEICLFKKICITSILCLLVIGLSVCFINTGIQLNPVVKSILDQKDIQNSKITYLANFEKSKIYYNKDKIYEEKVTDDEIQNYVDILMSSHEELIEIKDRTIVQTKDVVIIDYVVKYNSNIVSKFEHIPIIVGLGEYDIELENSLLGKKVGVPFLCKLKATVTTDEYNQGDILQYEININSINYFKTYKPSDEYILQYYGFASEEEFLKDCKFRVAQQKVRDVKSSVDEEFLDVLIDECRFHIDKKEVANYSTKIVEDYSLLASIYGLELEDYVEQKLKISEEEFYDLCYAEGEKEIKKYLFVGAFCAKMENVFDDEEFAEFCSMNGYEDEKGINTNAKYNFLKNLCINSIASIDYVSYLVGYKVPIENDTECTVKICNTDNISNLNLSISGEKVSDTKSKEILSEVKTLTFEETQYFYGDNLYDSVLLFEMPNKALVKIMIDQKNGFLTMRVYKDDNGYPYIVKAKTTDKLLHLIRNL